MIYELRRRGYDVMAMGWQRDRSNPCRTLSGIYTLAWIDPATGKHPVPLIEPSVKSVSTCLEWLNNAIEIGKRYCLRVSWKGKRYGHVISAFKREDGSLTLFDPLTGQHHESAEDIKAFLSQVSVKPPHPFIRQSLLNGCGFPRL